MIITGLLFQVSNMDQTHEVTALLYRIQALEQQVKHLQEQLKAYVPVRENELQLQNIQNSVSRIERDVIAIRTKQEELEKDGQKRDEAQQMSQASLQIKVLWGIVSSLIFVGTSIFIGYITHFFH